MVLSLAVAPPGARRNLRPLTGSWAAFLSAVAFAASPVHDGPRAPSGVASLDLSPASRPLQRALDL